MIFPFLEETESIRRDALHYETEQKWSFERRRITRVAKAWRLSDAEARSFSGDASGMNQPLISSPNDGRTVSALLPVLAFIFVPLATTVQALNLTPEHSVLETSATECDGTFKLQDSPSPGRFASLSDVSFASSDSGWAVGQSHARDGEVWIKPLILHWNGATWTRQRVDLGKNAYLTSVVALAQDDVWAAGSILAPYNKPLILHWDGSGWTRQESPDNFVPGRENAHLFAIDGALSGEAWSVGTVHEEEDLPDGAISFGGVRSRPLILRRDGAHGPVRPFQR